LQGLEDNYPGAAWLPVACQNLAEESLTWQGMKNFANVLPTQLWRLLPVLLSVLITVVVITLQNLIIKTLGFDNASSFPSSSSSVVSSATNSEGKKIINSIFQKVLKRNATSYELYAYVNYLEKGATVDSITAEIIKTSSLLQNGNIILLDCQGNIHTGLKWLDGSTEDGTVKLARDTSINFTGTRWKVHTIRDGVVALENQGKINGLRWLYARIDPLASNNGSVNLALERDSNKFTEWRVHILGHEIIMLENQNKFGSLVWLNGHTPSGNVGLEPDTTGTGTRWRIIKQ
jgi:hypothetical protein